MIFNTNKHNSNLYNSLLSLSRNFLFYKELSFKDIYETRIYLIFFHYSIILFTQKNKKLKPDQENYNNLFFYIENNLREMGFGDVSVNKKMKFLNKIFYDILIKISLSNKSLNLNKDLIIKYFSELENNDNKMKKFMDYLNNFYNFCFESSPENMIEDLKKYKY